MCSASTIPSPTVRKSTLFMFMHVAAAKGWDVIHIDFRNAYKEVPPEQLPELYMKLSKAVHEQGQLLGHEAG
jgi:hypothetical protein